jgi:protease IV
MPHDADLLADRRRIRRKLSLWRGLAALAGLVALAVIGWRIAGDGAGRALDTRHIARITVSGVITGEKRTLEMIDRIGKSNAAAAIIKIDSPGGTVSGSEALYDALRKLNARKPTVAVVDGVAASGGYIAALASDRIIARQTAIVGSIGVLMQYPNVAKLLDNWGVKIEIQRSSPLKAAPSGVEPTSPEARVALQRVIDDNYDWFKSLVRTRRNLSEAEAISLADGRVHTGRQGLPLKLVDKLGDEGDALDWLASEKKIDRKLPIRDWKPRNDSDPFGAFGVSGQMARLLGLPVLGGIFDQLSENHIRLRLDAPLALWQPQQE